MILTRIKRGASRTQILVRSRFSTTLTRPSSGRLVRLVRSVSLTLMAVQMAVPAPLMASSGTAVALADSDPLPHTHSISPSASSSIQFNGDKPDSLVVAQDSLPGVQAGKSLATEKQEEDDRLAQQRIEEENQRRLNEEHKKQVLLASAQFPISADQTAVQNMVREVTVANFGENEVQAMFNLINRESGFNPNALNNTSGACGLFQALPCSKLGGLEVNSQVNWGIGYIKQRYGTPTQAWNFWLTHNWY